MAESPMVGRNEARAHRNLSEVVEKSLDMNQNSKDETLRGMHS